MKNVPASEDVAFSIALALGLKQKGSPAHVALARIDFEPFQELGFAVLGGR